MTKNNTAIKAVAIVLGLLATACGHGSTPMGPTTGASSLAVTVTGNIAGQVAPILPSSGSIVTVQITGPSSASALVGADGVARFSGIPDGNYAITATSDFGYQGTTGSAMVSGSVATTVTLTAGYDLKVLAVTANGVPVKSGDKVATPTNLQFQIQFMNPGTSPSVTAVPIVRAGSTTVGFVFPSAPMVAGTQTLTLSIPNFRPCEAVSGNPVYTSNCFTQTSSVLFLAVNTTSTVLQNTMPFVMNF